MRQILKNVKQKLVAKYLDNTSSKRKKNLNLELKLESGKIDKL